MTAAAALALSLTCAPQVSPDVLLSVARTESAWNPLAIHDNQTEEAIAPATRSDAVRTAKALIAAGHRPDLGLLQINATNLARTGLTVETAFDACASMRAGAQILVEGYRGGAATAEQQVAILRALSEYNTGSPVAGLGTYAHAVLAAAHEVIPALRLAGVQPYDAPSPPPSDPAKAADAQSQKQNPSGWDVAADARKERAGRQSSSLLTFTHRETGK